MYAKEHAEMLKPFAGQKWRPSNGFEGDIFTSHVCASCAAGPCSRCDVASRAMIHDIKDPEYPAEWQIGKDGLPTCDAWTVKKRQQMKRRTSDTLT